MITDYHMKKAMILKVIDKLKLKAEKECFQPLHKP